RLSPFEFAAEPRQCPLRRPGLDDSRWCYRQVSATRTNRRYAADGGVAARKRRSGNPGKAEPFRTAGGGAAGKCPKSSVRNAAVRRSLTSAGVAASERRSGNPRKGGAFPYGGRRSRWKMSKVQIRGRAAATHRLTHGNDGS